MARQTKEYLRQKIWRLEDEALVSALSHQGEMNSAKEAIDTLKRDCDSAKESLEFVRSEAKDWRSRTTRLNDALSTLAEIAGIGDTYRLRDGRVGTNELVEDLEEYAKSDIAALNRTERLKRLGITKEEN